MGLLDDAIREHLDLKRRNGGDPGEIARKENEALTPVLEDAGTPEVEVGTPTPVAENAAAIEDTAYAPPAPAGAHEPARDPAPSEPTDFEDVGDETAELDMEAVLSEPDQSAAPDEHPSAVAARPVRASQPSGNAEEDSLEWEMPGAGAREGDAEAVPPEIPGQERLTFE
jgi:hypothetical protein